MGQPMSPVQSQGLQGMYRTGVSLERNRDRICRIWQSRKRTFLGLNLCHITIKREKTRTIWAFCKKSRLKVNKTIIRQLFPIYIYIYTYKNQLNHTSTSITTVNDMHRSGLVYRCSRSPAEMQAINGMNAVLQRVRGKTETRRNTTAVSSCHHFPCN